MLKADSIMLFRQDLRLHDNPALVKAVKAGVVLPVYILDDLAPDKFKIGSASKIYLYNSLKSLNNSLNGCLNIYIGNPKNIITDLVTRYKVKNICMNELYEPWVIDSDKEIHSSVSSVDVKITTCNGSYLWNPKNVLKDDGSYYKLFTAYKKKALSIPFRQVLEKPSEIRAILDTKNKTTIDDLNLIPKHSWHTNISKNWEYGEEVAQEKLHNFLFNKLNGYKINRDYPAKNSTSMLSASLHFGEISPSQIWHGLSVAQQMQNINDLDLEHFLSELIWREFSCYLMYHFKDLCFANFQQKFDRFPWHYSEEHFNAWKSGKTGIPIIDAGMRELWKTGYMHNRVRMIVASFLVKNLMIHWHYGRDWFWDCLVDADLANNSASWQWVAGSGVDAAPYFRIFNPITQGEKFDANGVYIKRFIPELRNVPDKYIFKPWEAPEGLMKSVGVNLGIDYPYPIIDIKTSRELALKAYKAL